MKKILMHAGVSAVLLLATCIGPLWGAGEPAATGLRNGSGEHVVADVEPAKRLANAVDSPESVRRAIEAWERVAAMRPDDAEAWTELGSLYLLEGAAYRSTARERRVCYDAALAACERAMATNEQFRSRRATGEPLGAAIDALGAREMGAMHFWSTGVFYIFKDCLGFFGRIRDRERMAVAKRMLERMDRVDAAWEDHTSTFSWGIYYLAMPVSRGGDRARARSCFDRAVALAPDRTLPRWGRGKYFLPAMKEAAAAQEDLRGVAERELDGLKGSRAWNRHFKTDAAARLGRTPAVESPGPRADSPGPRRENP